MTLYQQITGNKLKTYLIIAIFIVLLSGFFFLIGKFFDSPETYFTFGLIFALVSSVGSYFYSDKIVLMTVRAKPANKKDHFDFYTVAENVSMAAGLPLPKLYVIEDSALNAFATGRDPKHAVVAATTGILEKLDRSDLEGVIAHEMSHIKNYDMLVSTVVAVLVGTVAIVADWVMRSLWWGGSDRDSDNRNPLMFVLLIAVLILAPLAATLIQLAVSRRREFLADSSGVLITRNPDGLADALEKIAGDPKPLRTATTSTAHLFISNPFKKQSKASWVTSLFSTHPPIEERIKILRSM